MSRSESFKEYTLNEIKNLVFLRLIYLKGRVLSIFIVTILTGLLVYCYNYLKPNLYQAKVVFILEESKTGSGSLGGVASLAGQFGIDLGSVASSGMLSGDNILYYFKTTELARRVLLSNSRYFPKKKIADIYCQVYGYNNKWEKVGYIDFQETSFRLNKRLHDSLLNEVAEDILKKRFNINKIDKKAGFIEVSFISKNELLSLEYTSRIVELATNNYLEIKTRRQKKLVESLQRRSDSLEFLLTNKTFKNVELYSQTQVMDLNPLYKIDKAYKIENTSREKLMLSTIFAEVTKNLEIAKFTLNQETPIIQIVDFNEQPLKKQPKRILFYTAVFSLFSSIAYSIILISKFKSKIDD